METNPNYHSHNCTLYPGDYFPILNSEEIMMELNKPHDGDSLQPFINVSYHDNYFKVEAAIPGLKREDFFISVDDNILSIAVLHKKTTENVKKQFQLHEFNYECFSRNIPLPDNIETEFVRADYHDGILSIYFPNSTNAQQRTHTHVVVY